MDWVHEVKFDGYRVQVHKSSGEVEIFSRRGYRFAHRFPIIVDYVRDLPAKTAILIASSWRTTERTSFTAA